MKAVNFTKILPGIAVAFACCFMLLVYAPMELYLTNQDDFWFTKGQMLTYTIALFIVGMLLCTVAFLVAEKLGSKLLTLGIAIGAFVMVGAYMQGTFLVSGLPGLDGAQIDWGAYPAERIKSIAVWVLSAVLVAVLWWKLGGDKFRIAAGLAGAGIGAMLLITLVMLGITTNGDKRETLASTDINILNVSDDKNLIVLHLDALDACAFEKVMEKHPEYRDILEDFTYFDNALSGYPYTKCSVPLILTGEWYTGEQNFNEYADAAIENSKLFKTLEERNYRIGLYDVDNIYLTKSIFDGRIDNLREDASIPASAREMAAMMVKMGMVKFAPWELKAKGYSLQDRLQDFRRFKGGDGFEYHDWSNLKFYERMKDENSITVDGVNSFKYIIVEGAHVPFKYDKDMNVIENGSYEQNIEAAITLAARLVQRMKEAGVYDNSAIVLMADHGYNENDDDTNLRQHPALFIKGMGEKHTFKVDNAPISYGDMSEAFVRLLDGKSSEECFDWHADDARERRFFKYDWTHLADFIEYTQTGQAEDMSTFLPTGNNK